MGYIERVGGHLSGIKKAVWTHARAGVSRKLGDEIEQAKVYKFAGELTLAILKEAAGKGDMHVARKAIDVLGEINMGALGDVDGIKIVEKVEDRPLDEACSEYVFGEEHARGITPKVISTWERTIPIEGAIAVYFDKGNRVQHVGRVAEDGDIVSKWGEGGHVFKHKPALVPTSYGVRVEYFRKPQ